MNELLSAINAEHNHNYEFRKKQEKKAILGDAKAAYIIQCRRDAPRCCFRIDLKQQSDSTFIIEKLVSFHSMPLH
jgi:hypothetical protein